jgi:hypothetical protein
MDGSPQITEWFCHPQRSRNYKSADGSTKIRYECANTVHGLLAVFLFRMLSLLQSSKQTKWSIWNATIAIAG